MDTNGAVILCVEDEAEIRRDLVDELLDAGYEVHEAGSGSEAIGRLAGLQPDLILCDVNMPGLSGLQLLEQVRARGDALGEVPFVLLTAYGDREHQIRGRALGADDYLIKPIDYDLLLATLASRLRNARRVHARVQSRIGDLESQLAQVDRRTATLPDRTALQAALAEGRGRRRRGLLVASFDELARHVQQLGSSFRTEAEQALIGQVQLLAPAQAYRIDSETFGLLFADADALDVSALGRLVEIECRSPACAAPVRLSTTLCYVHCEPEVGCDVADRLEDACLAVRFGRRDGGHTLLRLDAAAVQRLRMAGHVEDHLLRALRDGEFTLHFQPKLQLADDRLVGAEALVRWHSRELGPISPGVFIPIAERCNLIEALSVWVLDEAARAAAVLAREGLDLAIAVNASGVELHAGFPTRVREVMAAHGLGAGQLDIELTETSVIADIRHAAGIVAELRGLGVGVAIDDFGTGYGSLSYLRALPVDTVKIDQSFVRGLPGNAIDRQIIESVLTLAHALGIGTVAEGVETAEQEREMRRLGCGQIQGYHLARPMPLAELIRFVRERR